MTPRSTCARRSSSTAPPTRTRATPTRCSSWSASRAARTTRAKDLSGGQRRRLDLALGLAGDPELIFLDEPTTGFDPAARRHSWELIANLRELGKTILLTTHYMDEAQQLADRVVVLAQGRVIADAAARPARPRGRRDRLLPRARLPRGPAAPGRRRDRARARALPHADADARPRARCSSGPPHRGMELERLTVSRPSLEDVYLELPPPPRKPPHEPHPDPQVDLRPLPHDRAQPARDGLHVRLPADPRRALQRAERQREGRQLRPAHPLRPVLHAGDRDLQPRHRLLHVAHHRPRQRA